MRSSYSEEDVILLLKDITGLVEPQPAKVREKLIQSGKHYSEMLPVEYVPTDQYMQVYHNALKHYAKPVANAVGMLADKIIENKGKKIVLVSLARVGIPIGILEKYRPQQILFVDGWIGKGAILNELKKDISAYEGVSADIAVVADPANVTELCGTHEDILIPSSCLNSTVSGLISRTFLRDDIIGRDDFHGAVYYGELTDSDLSYDFIETIEKEFNMENTPDLEKRVESQGIDEVINIGKNFGIDDINLIKPGIGETTRVLLRRIPWKVLIDERYKGNPQLEHIVRLAEEKHTPVEYYPLIHYKCCGIIKKLADA